MGNTKSNKNAKHALCYFGLVVLVVLLFIPPVFRIVFSDKKEKKSDKLVVTVLRCNKGDEKIQSSFQNDDPQNISYTIPGNAVAEQSSEEETTKEETKEENKEETTEQSDETANPVKKLFLKYATFSYNESNNNSTIKVSISTVKGSADYELIFDSITHQEEYFKSQGFSCTKETY